MDTDKPKPAYYAIIPAAVRYDQELPAGAKLLYGEITALCGKEGYCWASNGYFAKLYGTDKGTISRWIRKLIKQKHLKCKIDKTAGNKRHLYLCAKMSIPIGKNAHTPIGKNAKHNNTSVIKTGKGGKDIKQKPTPKPQASAPAPESKEDIGPRPKPRGCR